MRLNGPAQRSIARNKDDFSGTPGRAVRILVLLCLLVLLPHAVPAEEGRGYYEVNSSYKTGDFGTPTRTNLLSISAGLGYVSPGFDVSATMPLLFLSSSGDDQAGLVNTNIGLGDLVLRAGRVFLAENDAGFSLDGALAVKLPTADETDGLGTGEPDYGAFFGAHKRFDKIKLSLLTGYIKVGDPPSIDYNDVYLYGTGISRMFGSTLAYAAYEGRRSVVPGVRNPQEISAGFLHALSADYAIKGSAFRGLNKAGPDFGLSLGFVSWF